MERKRKKYLLMIGIIVLVLSAVGVSYAIWSRTVEQTGTNIIQLDCFQIEFDENEDSNIHLSNAFPILDSEGEKLEPYHFKVINKCDSYASYQVRIEVKQNSNLNDEYLKVMLNKNYPKILKNENYEVTDVLLGKDTKHAYILETGYLDTNETKEYDLRLWLDESVTLESINSDNSKIENSTWGGIITISSSYASKRTAILANKEIEIVKEGDGLYEVRHDEVSGTVDDLGFSQTEYRYAGTNPNNYVTFNGELWRIIGLVNVLVPQEDGTSKVEQRLKIVRKDSIGDLSWDTSAYSVNTGWGVNEWSKSDLMKLLNPDYESNEGPICSYNAEQKITTCNDKNDLVNNSLYWNGKDGNCYNGASNQTTNCNFTDGNKMPEILKTMIETVTWNTGAGDENYDTKGTVSKFYEYERSSNTGKICVGGTNGCNDEVDRTTSWTGKVGLIYPSDYGFAISENIDETIRETCLKKQVMNNYRDCINNNWLFTKKHNWTLSPYANAGYAGSSYDIQSTGQVQKDGAGNRFEVHPTVYLKPNVVVKNLDTADGSVSQPYELALLNS